MSGIFGILHLNGQPVQPRVLHEMSDVLAHRGQDNSGIWTEGSVGLGSRLLWTTPESLQEKLPIGHQSDTFMLTADARIDNRDELIRLFGLDDRPPQDITDSDLILYAYEKWGVACPYYLIGAFAFALWDKQQRKLFCARDHIGIRPFYYYTNGSLFAFASEIKALLCVPQFQRRINEERVVQQFLFSVEDKEITFYKDVLRLPPAHSLIISHTGLELQQYWDLDPTKEVNLPSDEAYAEAFLEIFTESVQSRLRANTPIGVLFSGGLDSSAVACMARNLHETGGLQTFSAIYSETKECDESTYIDAVLAQGNMQPHYVDVDQLSPFTNFEQVLQHMDEPFTAPTYYLMWSMCRVASEQGVGILLDGIDGDTAVYHGDGYLGDLARQGNWSTFVAEAYAIAEHENLPPAGFLFERYGKPYLTELAQQGKWVSFLREINDLSQYAATPRRQLFKNYGLKPVIPESVWQAWRTLRGSKYPNDNQAKVAKQKAHVLNPQFAKRLGVGKDFLSIVGSNDHQMQNARAEHYALLNAGLVPYAFEVADKIGSAFSIEGRHPFADRRLIEFSLATPPAQKLHQGWIRMILRRALDGILPEEIQWRGGKTLNSAAITKSLIKNGQGRMSNEIVADPIYLEQYMDVDGLRKIYKRYLQNKNPEDEMIIWQATTLSVWLRENEFEF